MVCNQPTPPGSRGNKKYCSRECAYPRKTPQPKQCLECQKDLVFKDRGRTKLTCSRRCRDLKKNAALKQARQITKFCFRCSNEFSSAKQAQRFCSAECRKAQFKDDHPHIRNTDPKTIICGWCEGEVIVPANFTGNGKYHDDCRVEAKRARYRIKTVKRQSLTVKPSRLSADQVVRTYGSKCSVCSEEIDMSIARTSRLGLTVDHVIPLSKGGQDTIENMRPAHWICNVRKGNKDRCLIPVSHKKN